MREKGRELTPVSRNIEIRRFSCLDSLVSTRSRFGPADII